MVGCAVIIGAGVNAGVGVALPQAIKLVLRNAQRIKAQNLSCIFASQSKRADVVWFDLKVTRLRFALAPLGARAIRSDEQLFGNCQPFVGPIDRHNIIDQFARVRAVGGHHPNAPRSTFRRTIKDEIAVG